MNPLRILRNLCLLLLLIAILGACRPGNADVDDADQPGPTSTVPAPPSATFAPTGTAVSEPTSTQPPADTPFPQAQPSATHEPTATAVPPTSLPEPTSTAPHHPVAPSATPDTPSQTRVPEPTATTAAELEESRPLVIVLDPGHDRTSPGALGIEYQYVLHTAFVAKAALEAAGYEVHLTREDNDFVFNEHPELLPPNASEMHPGYGAAYAHASKALEFNPDLVLILHYNGHPNPDVRGIEIYYCELGGPQNLVLAEIVRDELVIALRSIGYETPSTRIAEDLTVARGGRHFPIMGNVYDPPTTWVENRYAGIPVVLTEPLYMTNPIERPLLDIDATHQAIADAYVRAVDRYFGR